MRTAAPSVGARAASPGYGELSREQHAGGHDGREPDPADQAPERGDEAMRGREPVSGDGQEPAGRQLPGPGRERVEGPADRRVGQDEVRRERPDDDEPEDGRHPDPPPSADEQQEGRPDEVELLLDRERPEVEERRRPGDRGEVVALGQREPDVGDGQRRGGTIGHDLRPVEETHEGPRRRERGDEHDRGRGQEAPDPAGVEPAERDPAAALVLAHEEAGDQEAADDEEDVDADEAAGDRQAGMEQDDEEDREPAEALDVRAERRPVGRS